MKMPQILLRIIMPVAMMLLFSSPYFAGDCLAQCGTLNPLNFCYDSYHIWTQKVNLTTTCSWTLTPNQSWLHANPTNGTGNATVTLTIDNNPSNVTRTGTLSWGGGISGTITITQNPSSSFSINPTTASYSASGSTGSVSANGSCYYAAFSSVPWITITSPNPSNYLIGAQTITYTVAPNTGQARTGTIEIAGNLHTITQASGCAYTISPTSTCVDPNNWSQPVNITAGAGCAWTATANAPWIHVNPTSGMGNGQVTVSIDFTGSASRTGTATIAGQTFTVTQNGSSSYSINPTSASFSPDGGPGSVNANGPCFYAAFSSASWITVTSGSTYTGAHTITYTVAANTGPARTGTVAIGGVDHTVTQAGCSYTISPTSNTTISNGGTTATINVTPNGGSCAWTAQVTSGSAYIHVTAGASGTGTGTVTYVVDPNMGPARTGVITVAGQTFNISQAGCTYTISPANNSIGPGSAIGSISVTPNGGSCQWTAQVTSGSSFLHITGGATGTGIGTVTYSVDSNTGDTRQGTINIAGQTFTLIQAGCTYTISPTSNNVGTGATTGSISVMAGNGCAWTAQVTSGGSFLHITGSATGTGNGTVSYSVDANPSGSASRQGVITVAGQTFTLTQAGNIDARVDLAVFITPSASTVSSGGQLTYTIDLRNAGPNTADNVTVTFTMPDGTTFSDQTGVSPGGFPGVGRTGPIVARFGSLPSGQSTRFTVRVNVLSASGVVLQGRAQITTISTESNPGDNTAVATTTVQGGGNIDLLFTPPPPPTDANPTPGVSNLEVRPATTSSSSSGGSQATSESEAGELTCTDASPKSELLGYRIYISSQTPVLTIDANLYKELTPAEMLSDPIAQKLFTGAPLDVHGSTYVLTTLYCQNGQKLEVGRTDGSGMPDPNNQVKVPSGPTLDSVVIKGSKMKISGSGFSDSVEISIDGKKFVKKAKVIDGGLLQKGGLETGESLLDLLVSGRQLLVSVKNSNGGIGTFNYTVR